MRQPHIYNHHHLDICFPILLPYPAHPEQHLGDPSSLGPDETHPVLKLQDISFGLSFLCSNIMASSVQRREESHLPDSEDVTLFNQQTLGLSQHQLLPTVCLKMSPPLPPPEMASTPRTRRREGWHLSRPGFLLFLIRNKMTECFGF